jgi:hypothetical protein
MLELNDIQGKILTAFVDYDGQNQGEIGKSVTSGKLEKLGINRKTFDNTDPKSVNNKDFLIKNYFLRITRKEKHGQQNWIYYKITTLGLIAYLKWAFNTDSSTNIIFSDTFLPLISKYFKIIYEIYGNTLSNILSNTSQKINVTPQVTGTFKNKSINSNSIVCSMSLRIGDFDIIYNQFLGKPILEEIKHIVDIDYDDKKNNKLNQKLSECFTFLFYYNLINSGSSSNEMFNLFLSENNYLHIENDNHNFDKKEFRIKFKKFIIKLKKNKKKILKLIKSDPKLHKLISNNFDKVLVKLNQTSILEDMRKNL